MSKFRILKQLIPSGQMGDPEWAERKLYVETITSGSYSGSNQIYNNKKEALLAIDDLENETYVGWGIEGNGRDFIPVELDMRDEVIKSEYMDDKLNKYKKNGEYNISKKIKPVIVEFYPTSSQWGDVIFISGSNLYGSTEVEFSKNVSTTNVTESSNYLLEVVVPTGSESGKITVLNYDGKQELSSDSLIISGSIKNKIKSLQKNKKP